MGIPMRFALVFTLIVSVPDFSAAVDDLQVDDLAMYCVKPLAVAEHRRGAAVVIRSAGVARRAFLLGVCGWVGIEPAGGKAP
jgi:hypothetical protein